MTAGYTYNGNGQRVKKVVNGTTTIFHYNLAGQLIVESNSAGATTSEYVYLNSQPLAKIEGGSVYYYHNDHLATPQKMTDSTGAVVWSADYKPFGEATITVSTITNNLRFPGQYFDAETGLNYNLNRDYNQVIGRYIESDPVGIQKGQNHLYVYVENTPINFPDPLGLAPNIPIDLPAEWKNFYHRSLGPDSCGPCERRTAIMVRNGYGKVIVNYEDNPAFHSEITLIIHYGQEVTWGCVPKCCKELPDFASSGRSSGTLFPISAWRRFLLNLVYDFYIETLHSMFDCSGCNNSCKKCG